MTAKRRSVKRAAATTPETLDIDPDNPLPPKMAPTPRGIEIAPVVRLDTDALLVGAGAQVDAFLAECEATGATKPEKQAILDRIAHLAGNIDPNATDGINSLAKNKRFVIHHKTTAPHFTVGTES